MALQYGLLHQYEATLMNTPQTNPPDEILCQCSGTTRGNIQSLFEQGLNLDAISRKTGALTGCGGCEWDIASFLFELTDQQNNKA